MTQKLPRFDIAAGALARGGADQLVRPLPPLLARLVAESDEARAHASVAARYGEQRTKVAGLREAITKAKATDAERERQALAKGRRPAKQQAPGLEDELAEAEWQLGVLDGLVAEYAASLLRVAVVHLPEASEQAQRSLDSALADVRDSIENAAATLQTANEAAAEFGWLVTLASEGHVHAFNSGGKNAQILPSVTEALARARASFDNDLLRRAEWREEVARQREFEDSRLAPGTVIWQEGRALVASESGELVPVEEVGRE
jgi:chromosome segregation ATPase